MKENDMLRKKFKALGFDKISDFVRSVNSELTQETWGAVLNRDKRADIRTLLKMTAELNFSPDDVKKILLARDEKLIAGWIAPATLTAEEQKVIECFRGIDQKKHKLVLDMLNTMKG